MRTSWTIRAAAITALLIGCGDGSHSGDASDVRTDVVTDTGFDAMDSSIDANDAEDVPMDVAMDTVDVAVDTPRDVQCDAPCPDRPNATGVCTAGTCGITCATGFADCNNDQSDGCEVNTQTSGAHCGACGTACGPTEGCMAGVCGACSASKMSCNGVCLDVSSDLMNCGGCANACPIAGPHQTASCTAGACDLTCEAGFTDCDSSATTGCESDLQADIMNCGACGHVCMVPAGSTPTCVLGVCGISSCPPGTGDCDGDPTNGCETDTTTSPMNCGSCGNACPSGPNSTASCTLSLCGLSCTNPFADCDGNAANGCEADLNAGTPSSSGSVDNCGVCGVNCPAAPDNSHSRAACNVGNCTIACTDPTHFDNCNGLNSDGCEQRLDADNHCATCINDCTSGGTSTNICLDTMVCSTNPANTSCAVATAIPRVALGATVTRTGPLPHLDSEQWFSVTFATRPGQNRSYTNRPTIVLTPPAGRAMRFEVSIGSCAGRTPFTCGQSNGVLNWSFADNAPPALGGTIRASLDPATTTFFIRVYIPSGFATGQSPENFTLTITNP